MVRKSQTIHTNISGYVHLEGYIPADSSGVTIATGYDLGHGDDISACVGRALWAKLAPYRNLKTRVSLLLCAQVREQSNGAALMSMGPFGEKM